MIAFHAVDAYEFSNDSERQAFNGNQDEQTRERHMITYALTVSRSQMSAWIFLLAGLLIISTTALGNEIDGEQRLSVTTQNTRVQRDDGIPGEISQDEFSPLLVSGKRVKSERGSLRSKLNMQTSQSPNIDFWFYSADVVLFNDHDRDGFYHGIDLLFDADTYFAFAEVYAVVYLSLDGGPWNEYAATENFTIFGTTSDDEYVIVTELLAGYVTGSYDILIELFDVYDDSYLAYIGPDDTSELAFLPLEDADRDVAAVPEVIVVNRGGGGALGWLFILALGLTALRRFRV